MMRLGWLALAAAAMMAATVGSAEATPATYTFSGVGAAYVCPSGDCDGATDVSGAFSFVITSDTSLVDTSGSPYFYLRNVDGTFTSGSYSATLTNVTLEANSDPSFENVDFYDHDFLNGLGLSDTALSGYNLLSSIGPITEPSPSGFLTPTFGGGSGFSTTAGDVLYFVSDDTLTFTANVPEPLTLSIVGAGLAGATLILRRKKK